MKINQIKKQRFIDFSCLLGMKRLFVLFEILLVSVLFNPGCKKNLPAFNGTASIIGGDPRVGPCEGGTFIQVDGHPNPGAQNGYYDIGTIPADFSTANDSLPLKVRIAYTIGGICGIVNITRIERIK